MADETEDPDIAAARLEAALERIARRAAEPRIQPVQPAPTPLADPSGEIAERLDSLIDRLRGALGNK